MAAKTLVQSAQVADITPGGQRRSTASLRPANAAWHTQHGIISRSDLERWDTRASAVLTPHLPR